MADSSSSEDDLRPPSKRTRVRRRKKRRLQQNVAIASSSSSSTPQSERSILSDAKNVSSSSSSTPRRRAAQPRIAGRAAAQRRHNPEEFSHSSASGDSASTDGMQDAVEPSAGDALIHQDVHPVDVTEPEGLLPDLGQQVMEHDNSDSSFGSRSGEGTNLIDSVSEHDSGTETSSTDSELGIVSGPEDSDISSVSNISDVSLRVSSTADSSDTSSSDDNGDPHGDEPLYPGSPISSSASLLAILTFAFAHSLTGVCISDLLSLIALHCINPNHCLSSLYKFKKYFQDIGSQVLVLHHFCVPCLLPLATKDAQCENCQGIGNKSFFEELPILAQIQAMFKRPGFYGKLQFRFNRVKSNPNAYEDIYDGALYQEYFQNNGFLSNPQNLSFMWYSDGISIFTSSKFSIWPLFLVINELGYKERTKKENIILAGLWFRELKPSPNLFLQPFHTSLQQFFNLGFNVDVPGVGAILVKALVLCGTCDLQAKALFLRFKTWSGYYGCAKCRIFGARFGLGNNNSVQVFPFTANVPLRTNESVARHAARAHARGRPVFGVKGPTLLYQIMPNMVRGVAIDIMHGVFLNLAKLLMKLHFDTAFSGEPFSLSDHLALVDERLRSIKPPSFVQSVPRSIKKHLAMWKALEFKMWILYYSIPILIDIMPENYLNHHMCLVSAIYLLSQKSVLPVHINDARVLLTRYVQDFTNLYSLRHMSFNVHQLLHLPDCVIDLGPLWVYSCFFLEDLNGKLTRLVHGTRHAGMQVCSGASVCMNLPVMIRSLPVNSPARSYCEKLMSEGKCLKVAENIAPKLSVIGSYQNLLQVPINIRNAVETTFDVVGGHYHQIFSKLRKSGVLYCSGDYTQSEHKNSTYIAYRADLNRSNLCKLNHFVRWSHCRCQVLCQCLPALFIGIGTVYERQVWQAQNVQDVHLAYLSKVQPTQTTVTSPVQQIECVCFYMSIARNEYLGKPINSLEVE